MEMFYSKRVDKDVPELWKTPFHRSRNKKIHKKGMDSVHCTDTPEYQVLKKILKTDKKKKRIERTHHLQRNKLTGLLGIKYDYFIIIGRYTNSKLEYS